MSQITPHILVVDDDTRLRRLLKKYLTENGFIVSQASGAQEAKELLKLFSFSILILDVMMPGQNGQELTKELRANGFETPILMLTAMGDIDNRIIGLEAGADDYLSKPFEPKELLLRINNILKRQIQHEVKKEVCFGDCVYDIKTKRLLKNDSPVLLTTAEQDLLNVLVSSLGDAISREDIALALKSDNLRAIDVQITRLRRKIETDIKKPICIQTVRGMGYILVPK
ncbi:MAG: response regulator [Alphaproteobacteria bacterium]|nr:response regulator [Alphaproteobacteria bacterium]